MVTALAGLVGTYAVTVIRVIFGATATVAGILLIPAVRRRIWRKRAPDLSALRKEAGKWVCLAVTNEGEAADFWAKIQVEPPAALIPHDEVLCAWWEGGKETRVCLVSGETRNLRILYNHGSRLVGRWFVPFIATRELDLAANPDADKVPFQRRFIQDDGVAGGVETEIVTVHVALWSDQDGVGMPQATSIAVRGGDIFGGDVAPNLVAQRLPGPPTCDSQPPRPSPGSCP
ncbi:MAG: hypothetical protein LAO05_02070 [Acidobacteriia bacterium]|nr:hypothetical protein [Terriglobia bacterium]